MLVIEKLSELIKLVSGIVFVLNMLVVIESGRNSYALISYQGYDQLESDSLTRPRFVPVTGESHINIP